MATRKARGRGSHAISMSKYVSQEENFQGARAYKDVRERELGSCAVPSRQRFVGSGDFSVGFALFLHIASLLSLSRTGH